MSSKLPDTVTPGAPLLGASGSGNGRVDIVIVNWNAGALLADCIESVLASQVEGYELGAIVIVDNASTDGSLDAIRARWGTRVICIANPRNLGFGRACNLGARQGSGEWVLLLNPDTKLSPTTLRDAVRSLDARRADKVAVCGIRLIDDEGKTSRSCARLPDWKMFLVGALGLDKLMPGRFHSHMMTEWDHESSRDVDHVIAAFYLVHRSVYDRIGGFDENFFVYLEDLDLSQRIHALGLRICYDAGIVAYHKGGGTSRAILARRLFLAQESRLRYARKHFSAPAALLVSGVTLLVEPFVRVLHAVLTGNFRGAWNVIEAYGMLYRSLLSGRGAQ